jgi:uncharacterized membrane protein YraQ (UPF0718 family)
MTGLFLVAYFVPFSSEQVSAAIRESFLLLSDYAREHVLLCLVPAFFIAGAIMVFLNQQSIVRYLGPDAPKPVAYGVAAVSGSILAVCSCTVLPIFKGIYRKGAGIGPAVAFLYSGPAINILAIVLTAKVLGLRLGIARAVGAIVFAVVVGLLMHWLFRKEDRARTTNPAMFQFDDDNSHRGLIRMGLFMGSMIGLLVFLNWGPSGDSGSVWEAIYRTRYFIAGAFALMLAFAVVRWFNGTERRAWVRATRDFAVQILPLLFAGVMVAGFLFGRPGHEAIIPERWVSRFVGGNSLSANLVASVAGALMYFATLTEVPIMQGLVGSGMGNGPALALLLAGPSLSLPSILVIHGELGWKKTVAYVGLVVLLSTTAGLLYGGIFGR